MLRLSLLALALGMLRGDPDARRPSPARGQVADSAHIVIAATTDVHGRVTGWDYAAGRAAPGGIVRVARVLDSLRARYPGQVVAVDAGDLLQGDPFAAYYGAIAPQDPHPIVEALNLAGYDAATPGNHDFDYGLPLMRRALAEATYPIVSANVRALPADTLLFSSSVVLRRGGVRIGITGFTTPGTMVWDRDQLRGRARVVPIGAAAPRAIAALRGASDVVIALVHSGMDGRSSYDTTGIGPDNVAATLASTTPRPDLVVVGHSHREMRDSVLGGVHFVQPPPFARGVSVVHLDLVREGGRWRVAAVRADLVSTVESAPSDRLAARLTARDAAVRQWADSTLGSATAPMRAAAARAGSSDVIDFVNAVQRREARSDLSVASAFDLSAGWDSGAVRMADLLTLYPYENTLKAIRISGEDLTAYLEQSARYFRVDPLGRVTLNDSIPGYNFDIVGGARYEIDLRRPVGDRIVGLAVRGRAVRPTDSFTMAVNSFRQTGAGGYAMLRGAPVVYDRGRDVRTLLAEAVARESPIVPSRYREDSWRIVPEAMAAQVRALFRVQGPPPPLARRDTVLLRILAMTDLHGRIGQVPRLQAAFDSLTRACDCPTVRLNAGDALRGALLSDATGGRSTLELLNRLGLSASAVGDQDLALSVDTLRRRMAEARYPWLTANIFDSASGAHPAWATPFVLVRAGPLQVAIVGYTTGDSRSLVRGDRVAGLRFGSGALALKSTLDSVRARRPDLTILLAHAGAQCDRGTCGGEIVELAEQLDRGRVDLIVAGHTHRVLETAAAGIPIVEAGRGGEAYAVADLIQTASGRQLRTRVVRVDSAARSDAAMVAVVRGYQRREDSIARRTVATVKLPLLATGAQHRAGALVAAARQAMLRTDVAIVPDDEVRAGIPAGPVTVGRLLEVQPAGNALVRLTLTGAQLRAALEHALVAGVPGAHVAGLVVRYDPKRPTGRRMVSMKLTHGGAVRPKARYTVALSSVVASGGDGYLELGRVPNEPAGLTDLDALISYLGRLPQPVEFSGAPGFVAAR